MTLKQNRELVLKDNRYIRAAIRRVGERGAKIAAEAAGVIAITAATKILNGDPRNSMIITGAEEVDEGYSKYIANGGKIDRSTYGKILGAVPTDIFRQEIGWRLGVAPITAYDVAKGGFVELFAGETVREILGFPSRADRTGKYWGRVEEMVARLCFVQSRLPEDLENTIKEARTIIWSIADIEMRAFNDSFAATARLLGKLHSE